MAHSSIQEVLEHLDLIKHTDKFTDNEITWDIFPFLNENDLIRMGLPVGPCKKIFRYIQQHYPTETTKSRSSSPEFSTPPLSPLNESLSVIFPPTDVDVNVKLIREYQDFKESVHAKFKETKEHVDMLHIRLVTLEQALVKHYQSL